MSLIISHQSIPVNASLHKFQKRVVDAQLGNNLYQVMPVGRYCNGSTGISYTIKKTLSTKLPLSSKLFNQFAKSNKRKCDKKAPCQNSPNKITSVESDSKDSTDVIFNFILKLKKELKLMVWRQLQFKPYFMSCYF